jgi:hypothetical protein
MGGLRRNSLQCEERSPACQGRSCQVIKENGKTHDERPTFGGRADIPIVAESVLKSSITAWHNSFKSVRCASSSLELTERNDMSLKFGACSAFAATLFGLALTTTRARIRRGGHAELSKPRASGYIVFQHAFSIASSRPRAARRPTLSGTVQRSGPDRFHQRCGPGWAVFAATSRLGPGALAGGYVGASGGRR